jgi:hypothetical protein
VQRNALGRQRLGLAMLAQHQRHPARVVQHKRQPAGRAGQLARVYGDRRARRAVYAPPAPRSPARRAIAGPPKHGRSRQRCVTKSITSWGQAHRSAGVWATCA